jgi:signal transduction histidine kinase
MNRQAAEMGDVMPIAPVGERRMRLSDGTVRLLRSGTVVLIVALYVGGFALQALSNPAEGGTSWGSGGLGAGLTYLAMTTLFPVAGAFITHSQPRNAVGWVLLGIGLAWGLDHLFNGFAAFAWLAHHRLVTAAHVAVQLDQWTWIPAIGLTGTFLLLLFPDGRLVSRRWRPVAWAAGAAMVVGIIAATFTPGTATDTGYPGFRNPLGLSPLRPLAGKFGVVIVVLPLAMIASAVSVVVRYRRSRGTERLQITWLAAAGCLVVLLFVVAMLGFLPLRTTRETVSLLSFGLIPAAVGVAVLKHRLYDIDVVINKALLYGALAAFVTAVYVAIVVGVGAAVGQGTHPNLSLSILATAVVALSFGPVKERIQRTANRLVYGDRASPYEILSAFSSRMAGRYAALDLLPKMAEALAKGTGAERTEVWLRTGSGRRLEGAWPGPTDPTGEVASSEPHQEDERSQVIPVSHQGELLGWIVVRKRPGDSFTPLDSRLLEDVAGQAGMVLRNVGLIEELRASRQRLVAAQDDERRKLERNIHDGAQQRLVALAVRFNLARKVVERDGSAELSGEIKGLADRAQAALENLRDLARGIYPPLLADKGLVAALEAQARKAPVPVTVLATGVDRYPQAIEAAVYFCCLEALQNVAKYADAHAVVIRLDGGEGDLAFEVTDDGRGYDGATTPLGSGLANMTDRLAAIDGSLEVRSRPGAGTTVSGRIPPGGPVGEETAPRGEAAMVGAGR